jgi:adenylylsulfate kinase-like enzyme
LNKNKNGIVFWITGLPGSGKSNISKSIFKDIEKCYGPTIRLNGDEARKMLNLRGYSKNERFKIGLKYHLLCKKISKTGVNIMFDVVCLFEKIRKKNKKNLKNYIEIFIKSESKILIKRKEKYFYKVKTNNVWGIDLKPELPQNPDIIIINNFKKSIKQLSNLLLKKIKKKIK